MLISTSAGFTTSAHTGVASADMTHSRVTSRTAGKGVGLCISFLLIANVTFVVGEMAARVLHCALARRGSAGVDGTCVLRCALMSAGVEVRYSNRPVP